MQVEQDSSSQTVDAGSVLEFLKGNPDFFNNNADILPKLRIPHETGGAISLIEKQLSVYRSKCSALETKLGELINVARENEELQKRLHDLIQEVISATTLDEVVSLTRDTLIKNFRADDARVILIEDEGGKKHEEEPRRYVAYDEPALSFFKENFSKGETSCSVPNPEQREFLFEENAKVGSIAIIPLQYQRDLGLIVLSSVDARRFDSTKGVLFLSEFGEMLSRRIATFL